MADETNTSCQHPPDQEADELRFIAEAILWLALCSFGIVYELVG